MTYCSWCKEDPVFTGLPTSVSYHYSRHHLHEAVDLLRAAVGKDGRGAAVVTYDRAHEPTHWIRHVEKFLERYADERGLR